MLFSNGTQITVNGEVRTEGVPASYLPISTDVHINGTLHDAAGFMYTTLDPNIGASDVFINGVRHSKDGVRYFDVAGPFISWPEGFAVTVDGRQSAQESIENFFIRGIARSVTGQMSVLPGSGSPLDNRLLDDLNLDEYLLDDTNTVDVYLLEGAPFFLFKTANLYALGVSAGNPESIGGSFRYDWQFKSDGTKAYTQRNNTSPAFSFREYNLSVPWSLQNADWSAVASVLIGGSNARTFEWSPDGTVLCTLTRWFSSNYRLDNYDQSATPWSIASGLGAATSATNISTSSFCVRWRPDGLMVFVDHNAGIIDALTVGVAFDASTVVTTPVTVFNAPADKGNTSSFRFSPDGMILYSVTSGNLLCSWNLTAPYDISAPFNFQTGISVILPTPLQVPRGLYVRPDNGNILLERDQSSQNVRSFV